MNNETIDYIKQNRNLFTLLWIILALVYSYLVAIGFKYLGYTFIVKNSAPFILLWGLILVLTHILVKTGIWIYFIDEIKKRRDEKCQKEKKNLRKKKR